jgi:hypothetical protein
MTSTRISRHVNAPRANVYRALLDARAVRDLPLGLSPADNEVGWQMSLEKLAALVEGG